MAKDQLDCQLWGFTRKAENSDWLPTKSTATARITRKARLFRVCSESCRYRLPLDGPSRESVVFQLRQSCFCRMFPEDREFENLQQRAADYLTARRLPAGERDTEPSASLQSKLNADPERSCSHDSCVLRILLAPAVLLGG